MSLLTNSVLVGRTVPNPYPSGGTWTIESIWVDGRGAVSATVRWSNDGMVTQGTLAPGTALWDALAADHEARV